MKRTFTITEVLDDLKARVNRTSQKLVAQDLQVTPQYICDVLKGRRDVSSNLAEAMGYTRRVRYEK